MWVTGEATTNSEAMLFHKTRHLIFPVLANQQEITPALCEHWMSSGGLWRTMNDWNGWREKERERGRQTESQGNTCCQRDLMRMIIMVVLKSISIPLPSNYQSWLNNHFTSKTFIFLFIFNKNLKLLRNYYFRDDKCITVITDSKNIENETTFMSL